MIIGRLDVIPFPHGASASLADSLEFLELSRLAGFGYVSSEQLDLPEIARAQSSHAFVTHEMHTDDTNYLLARGTGKQVLGIAVYTLLLEQSKVNIDAIAVRPGYRRQGIGSSLVRHAELNAIASGAQTAELASLSKSVKFYQSCGYGRADNSKIPTMTKDLTSQST